MQPPHAPSAHAAPCTAPTCRCNRPPSPAHPPPLPRAQHKATHLTLQCSHCKMTVEVACKPGHGGAFVPRKCPNSAAPNPGIPGSECPIDSLAPLPERSAYVDQQSLKLQVKTPARLPA